MDTIVKGFIYILISYEYKRKCLKVVIDEKSMTKRNGLPPKRNDDSMSFPANGSDPLELS
jgi:hypothetical protein